MAVNFQVPDIKMKGYRLRQVNLSLWATKPALPLQFSPNEIRVGKRSTRRAFWNRLISSSGLLVDVVTPLSFPLYVGEILLVESTSQFEQAGDPDIELARVESSEVVHFGLQLIRYRSALQFESTTIKWAVLEGIWNIRGQLVVRGRSPFFARSESAKRHFEDAAKHYTDKELLETFEPNAVEKVAEKGKWLALKDIHPKTVNAIEQSNMVSGDEKKRAEHLRKAAEEFGKDFYSLRKQNVWPAKQNVTPTIWPLDKVSAAARKSIGRRKLRPNPADRYMATCWISKKLAAMTAAQLAKHLNEHFSTSFTASQIRTRRKRLELFVDQNSYPIR